MVKSGIRITLAVTFLIGFLTCILRVNAGTMLSSEEEIQTQQSTLLEEKVPVFKAIFNFNSKLQLGDGEITELTSKTKNSPHFWLKYQDPLIDIPLVPPELINA